MSEDKIEFAKDLVASNISKANKEESSSSNSDDVSTIKKLIIRFDKSKENER